MTSAYTTNKSIEQPGNNDYINTWNVPVNADWAIIDLALGGQITFTVTGQPATTTWTTLAPSNYQPLYLIFAGTLTYNQTYNFPSGIGGQWVVYNGTTGAFTLTIGSAGGGANVVIGAGVRTLIMSDGTNVYLSSNAVTPAAAGTLTGTTLAANVIASSLTSVGTLTSGAWNATPVGVAYGGTGLSATPTNGQLNIGNGTGFTLATLTAGTGVTITNTPGAISIATINPPQIRTQLFVVGTSTWTAPTGVTQVYAAVVGGGGGGSGSYAGGIGGIAIGVYTVSPGTGYTCIGGAGGAGTTGSVGSTGGTSSFASFATATGGAGGNNTSGNGADGVGSSGTLRNASARWVAQGTPLGGAQTTGAGTTAASSWGTGSESMAGGAGPAAQLGGNSGAVYLMWVG